jgi:hypothetical protein
MMVGAFVCCNGVLAGWRDELREVELWGWRSFQPIH